jgi:hypothetical protein
MEGQDRPPQIDQVWAERFLISVRCQNAAAERDRQLRQFERLLPPCRDQYLRHHREEIIKELYKSRK